MRQLLIVAVLLAVASISSAQDPTQYYLIGAGDEIFISINKGSRLSQYVNVAADGSVSIPLSHGRIHVAGMTEQDAAAAIGRAVRLADKPHIAVRVSTYASHPVEISGDVDNPGTLYLRREALPLYVARAIAGVRPTAATVSIVRRTGERLRRSLTAAATEDLLIAAGDSVRFETASADQTVGYFYLDLGGSVERQNLRQGQTLSNVVSDSRIAGRFSTVSVAGYSRTGLLERKLFDLKRLAKGNAPDLAIAQGDIISLR